MYPMPKNCPVCGESLLITKLYCPRCNTSLEGQFTPGHFSHLTPEQWEFVEMFIRFEGKLKYIGAELNLSYPTVRNRLHEIIRALGYEPGRAENAPSRTSPDRQEVLNRLEKGEISAQEALSLLRGEN